MEKSQEATSKLDLSKLSYSSLRRIQTLFGIKPTPKATILDIIKSILEPLASATNDSELIIDKFLKIKKDDPADDHSIKKSLRQKPRSTCWRSSSS
jgi:hypothetical protein